MKNIIRKKYSGIISLFVILAFLIIPSLTFAQKLTHIVQKGDTLWGICEKYYGDPNLWPKLWEMNSFITNPHLLKAGDVVTLFEKPPVKEEVQEVKEEPKPEVKEEKPVEKPAEVKAKPKPVMGIDVGSITEKNAIGFLSREKIQPWGSIFAADKDKLMLSKGETAYVIFAEDKEIKIGDKYLIGVSSSSLDHPITHKHLGYTFDVHGVLTIEERLGRAQKHNEYFEKKNVFRATISESYRPIAVKDLLTPFKPISSCLFPVSCDKKLVGNVVAVKDKEEFIHSGSVVYVDLGANDGLKQGNILSIVKPNEVPDPNPDEKLFAIWKSKIILPDIFIGRMMIIETWPEYSTAIVLSAGDQFSTGVFLKDLSWEKSPDFLSEIASCQIK
jgi:hypothetical protein